MRAVEEGVCGRAGSARLYSAAHLALSHGATSLLQQQPVLNRCLGGFRWACSWSYRVVVPATSERVQPMLNQGAEAAEVVAVADGGINRGCVKDVGAEANHAQRVSSCHSVSDKK